MRPNETGGIAMQTLGGIRIFSGATAIVTGGASGIGRAIAEALATRGCDVVLADLQIESAQKVASDLIPPSPHHKLPHGNQGIDFRRCGFFE